MRIIASTLLILCLSSCATENSQPTSTKKPWIEHVDASRAAKLLAEQPDTVVLDFRTPAEFSAGHIASAINIDFLAGDFAENVGGLDRGDRYLVYCRSGRRSTKSLSVLGGLGFVDVVHLDGGFLSWQQSQ